ncbi:serine hydrolase [Bradyrhizobium sp. Ai1a-2]|uniref:serine hydrolase domain-containing protein n=1 Tax=Bradyrhizobium sp. Ai1a-2 TaxID=196490 RepID=UPI001268E214|nr:serine hydrolase [Bradyrhizobium sp. Ai1a-2]
MRFKMLTLVGLVASFHSLGAFNRPAAATDDQGPQEILWPTKSWQTSSPEEQGMDSASLARLIENVGAYKQDSLTIIRHGKIVADVSYAPYIAGISHDVRSVTKSVVGTLTAIELQKGDLDSVDHPVIDLFSDKQIQDVDDRKKAMTVQSLLDMTSGIEWLQKAYRPGEKIMTMYESPDRTAFVLNQPMAGAPGASFNYNGGNPYLLSALINRKSGQSALDFAKKELFEPLGIHSARWGNVDAQGVTDGEAGLYLAPHDMARIGYLYLHNGQWEGKQLIPPSWVERAKSGPVAATSGFHYGNLWWSYPEKGAYMARGRHSQLILIIPRLDVIVVMTGALRDTESYSTSDLIDDISHAVKADKPLPEDPIAKALLTEATRRAATEKPYAVGGTPELAKAVSGKVYHFFDNRLRLKSFTLNFYDSDSSWVITTYTDEGDGRFTGLVGLHGAYRKSPPALYGINAARGRWTSEHTFVMERRILGHSEIQTWALTFDGDKVKVNFENTDGFTAELRGETTE